MGMPITVEIAGNGHEGIIEKIFEYFSFIDETFSTYKESSEIQKINTGLLLEKDFSAEMKTVLSLSEQTKQQTNGFFDIQTPQGTLDPSGLVKGWAIYQAADIITKAGLKNFFIEAGGDIQTSGQSGDGSPWKIGIKNPFNEKEIIKTVLITDQGIATSGNYIRGQHIYNPKKPQGALKDIVSLSVIGPNIYEADRFATAAFAMGKTGILFIEQLPGFEGYSIDKNGIATMTSGFEKYCVAS